MKDEVNKNKNLSDFLNFLPSPLYRIKREIDHIIWHITNKCPLNCNYCFTDSRINLTQNFEKLPKIAKKILKLDPKRVSIIGGEPLLAGKYLIKILKILKKKNITINLDTNLTLFSPNLYFQIKNFVDEWNTTVDHYKETEHNKLRGMWKKTMEAISFLKENGEIVNVVVVVHKQNKNDLEKIVNYLFNLKVNRVVLSKIRPFGRGFYSSFLLSKKDIEKIIPTLKRIKRNYGEKVGIMGFLHPNIIKTFPSCYCGINRMVVDWDGNIYPCELMVGKINTISLLNNSRSEILKYWKKWPSTVLLCPPSCLNCKVKDKCSKICRFASFSINNNPFSTPFFCDISKRNLYDLIGYERYSPIFKKGKERWKFITGKLLKRNISLMKDPIFELGAGGGIWVSFFEEVLKRKIVGIEKDIRMIFLWELYRKKKKLKSKIEHIDVKNLENIGTGLFLDNFITHFSSRELVRIFKRCEVCVIEFYEIDKVEKYTHKFENGATEVGIPLGENKIKKKVINGPFNFSMIQYLYDLNKIKKLLSEAQHKIIKQYKKSNYVFLISKKK